MPFEPLKPEEERHVKEPCHSSEHNPPSHMVITQPTAWVCPACGRRVVIRPPTVRW